MGISLTWLVMPHLWARTTSLKASEVYNNAAARQLQSIFFQHRDSIWCNQKGSVAELVLQAARERELGRAWVCPDRFLASCLSHSGRLVACRRSSLPADLTDFNPSACLSLSVEPSLWGSQQWWKVWVVGSCFWRGVVSEAWEQRRKERGGEKGRKSYHVNT